MTHHGVGDALITAELLVVALLAAAVAYGAAARRGTWPVASPRRSR